MNATANHTGGPIITPQQVDAIREALVRFDGSAQIAAAFQASAELIGGSNPSMDAHRRRNEEWAVALRGLLASAQHDPRAHTADCAYQVDQYLHECACGLAASVAGAGTAKTAQPVEGEARQNGAQSADAQPSPPSD